MVITTNCLREASKAAARKQLPENDTQEAYGDDPTGNICSMHECQNV